MGGFRLFGRIASNRTTWVPRCEVFLRDRYWVGSVKQPIILKASFNG
jgi:hypothetical protein